MAFQALACELFKHCAHKALQDVFSRGMFLGLAWPLVKINSRSLRVNGKFSFPMSNFVVGDVCSGVPEILALVKLCWWLISWLKMHDARRTFRSTEERRILAKFEQVGQP